MGNGSETLSEKKQKGNEINFSLDTVWLLGTDIAVMVGIILGSILGIRDKPCCPSPIKGTVRKNHIPLFIYELMVDFHLIIPS